MSKRIASNIAERIKVLYSTYDAKTAFTKSKDLLQEDLTFIYLETHKQALREARECMRVSVYNLQKEFELRVKSGQ